MFTLIVSLKVRPNKMSRFVDAIERQSRASIRDEPGCLQFDVYRVKDEPLRFILYEVYTDETSYFEAHRSTPHYVVWRRAVDELVEPGSQTNTFCEPAFSATPARQRSATVE